MITMNILLIETKGNNRKQIYINREIIDAMARNLFTFCSKCFSITREFFKTIYLIIKENEYESFTTSEGKI